jgi:hypothetical protein
MVDVWQYQLTDGDKFATLANGFHILRAGADAEGAEPEIAALTDVAFGESIHRFDRKLW